MADKCYWLVCFTHLNATDIKFFGFSEFLAALALMVLAWTIADTRYKFRIRTAPLPLQGLTFWVVGVVGVLSLLTDWWRAEGWLVPRGNLISPFGWQALLGAFFLLSFLMWVWFAFIRPASFSKLNSTRFAQEMYRLILKGSPAELPEIADELPRSARALIRYSLETHEIQRQPESNKKKAHNRKVSEDAYFLLQLLADRKFCRHVVHTSPIIALALFEEIALQKKYSVPLGIFAKNITAEAIENFDSFAYHEVSSYLSGYVGHAKPLSKALYGNFKIVEGLSEVFAVNYLERERWTSKQWEAFLRLVSITFDAYSKSGTVSNHSSVIYRVLGDIKEAGRGIGKLNTLENWWPNEEYYKFDAAVKFSIQMCKALDKNVDPRSEYFVLRRKKTEHGHDIYDSIAKLMFELIFEASAVSEPRETCWTIQYNGVWDDFFHSFSPDGSSSKIIKFKLRRLLYDEIKRMNDFPNFKSARLLSLLLNVLGLQKEPRTADRRSTHALKQVVLRWTARNYVRLIQGNPRIGARCLVQSVTYDEGNHRLIYIGPKILDREPSMTYLQLEYA